MTEKHWPSSIVDIRQIHNILSLIRENVIQSQEPRAESHVLYHLIFTTNLWGRYLISTVQIRKLNREVMLLAQGHRASKQEARIQTWTVRLQNPSS